jgi:hypothetical protein
VHPRTKQVTQERRCTDGNLCAAAVAKQHERPRPVWPIAGRAGLPHNHLRHAARKDRPVAWISSDRDLEHVAEIDQAAQELVTPQPHAIEQLPESGKRPRARESHALDRIRKDVANDHHVWQQCLDVIEEQCLFRQQLVA